MRVRLAFAAAVASMFLVAACEDLPKPQAGRSKAPDDYTTAPDACDVIGPGVVQGFLGSRAKSEDKTLRVGTEECEWKRGGEAFTTRSQWTSLSTHVEREKGGAKSSGADQAKVTLAGMRRTLHKPGTTSLGTCKVAAGDCFYLVDFAAKDGELNFAALTVIVRRHNVLMWVLATGQNLYPDQKGRMDADAARLATELAAHLR